MDKLIVDVGSATVKVYIVDGENVVPLLRRSFHFKTGFNPDTGISAEAEEGLVRLFEGLKHSHEGAAIKIFATGIFRQLNGAVRAAFVDRFFLKTGLFFNIISQDLESFYLEKALVGKCNLSEPILLINIGGGSTELIVMHNSVVVERHNIEGLGVGAILAEFPGINREHSDVPLEKVLEFVGEKLPVVESQIRYGLYNGGELTYMKLVGYNLQENTAFADTDHPFMISADDFAVGNKRVFDTVAIDDLMSLMPDDPKWMYGARACSAIAQAVVKRFGIEYIIPSDSNTAHGIVRQEFRRVTLSGSFRKHLDYILTIKQLLGARHVQILSPRFEEPKNPGETFVVFEGEEGLTPLELERHHLKSIDESDALIVCSPGGYVGASALTEIGYAHSCGKRIIFTEKPEEFMLNTLPAEVGI